MKTMHAQALLFSVMCLLSLACGGPQATPANATVPVTESSVTVRPQERSPLDSQPQIALRTPEESAVIADGNVMLDIQLSAWTLGPHPGNHVHLIVDNEPYIALRDVSEPLNLSALYEESFGRPLSPGLHVVRMFPSRGHHESVKEGRPFVVRSFYVGSRDDARFDPSAPLITFSRPKGTSAPDSEVLLDFYVSGIDGLSPDGYRARVTIDGHAHLLERWVPYHIHGLTTGTHEIRLELVGPNGETVPGPFNNTLRSIEIGAAAHH